MNEVDLIARLWWLVGILGGLCALLIGLLYTGLRSNINALRARMDKTMATKDQVAKLEGDMEDAIDQFREQLRDRDTALTDSLKRIELSLSETHKRIDGLLAARAGVPHG